MFALSYYCGDINPLLGDIGTLGIHGLLIEESKKGFVLDAVDIRRRLDPAVALFGNLDSVSVLLEGSEEDVARETRRQMAAAGSGPFVMANGSPVALRTPPGNLRAMVRTARGLQGCGMDGRAAQGILPVGHIS